MCVSSIVTLTPTMQRIELDTVVPLIANELPQAVVSITDAAFKDATGSGPAAKQAGEQTSTEVTATTASGSLGHGC
jgi:hypothetical protein